MSTVASELVKIPLLTVNVKEVLPLKFSGGTYRMLAVLVPVKVMDDRVPSEGCEDIKKVKLLPSGSCPSRKMLRVSSSIMLTDWEIAIGIELGVIELDAIDGSLSPTLLEAVTVKV